MTQVGKGLGLLVTSPGLVPINQELVCPSAAEVCVQAIDAQAIWSQLLGASSQGAQLEAAPIDDVMEDAQPSEHCSAKSSWC